ncbi:MAG: ABC transporter substrate-binding protein [Planctomycetota bacterium]|nr:ABC transporter substrate-binding protein [Planctomycetota bacterium]
MARLGRVLLLLTTCLGLLGTAGCGDDYDGLVIGVVLPMTGPQATYGEESWNGLQLAEADLRQAGTNIKFKLVLKDEKSTPQEAQTQAKTLMELEGAHVLLGSVASSNTKTIAGAAKENGTPCITPASTNDNLTTGNPWLSRICYKDSVQGGVLATFALSNGWKRAAVCVDNESDYSRGFADNFKGAFEAAGGTTHFEYFKAGNADYSNVIQGVADANPDVIFISGYYEDGGPMIKQAKARWEGKPVIGGDGLDSAEFLTLIGDAQNPIYFSTHFAPDAPDEPAVKAFAERYRERFGKEPGAMAALGYDVLFVLMDAAKRCANPKSAAELNTAIGATKNVKGITGLISLDNPDRTPNKPLVIVKVEGGAKKFHSTIKP